MLTVQRTYLATSLTSAALAVLYIVWFPGRNVLLLEVHDLGAGLLLIG